MIEFRLDGRSGVAPYLQLVHQVRHALRLGLLHEGDQLPTVKEVVAQVAINPNTVLKAYRELEHEGLAAARPGVGTFVTGPSPTTPSPRTARCARARALAREGATRRARRGEHRGAVRRHLSFRADGAGRSMTPSIAAGRPRQAVPPPVGALGLHARGPAGPRGRAGRPQRRRQDDPPAPGRRAARAHRGHDRGARAVARPRSGAARPGSVSSPRTRPTVRRAQRRRPPPARRQLNPRLGRRARRRAASTRLGLDPTQRAGQLSGGQRAQLALTLGGGQASRAAAPRRARGQPRSVGAARVPPGLMEASPSMALSVVLVVAPGRRPRAGLRLPHRAGRSPGAARRRRRGAARDAPRPDRSPARCRQSARRHKR